MLKILNKPTFIQQIKKIRRFSSQPAAAATEIEDNKNNAENIRRNVVDYRHVYPEFLPDPKIEWRNKIREKLERSDMIARRTNIVIPEFYVGSILAVTYSDPHSPGTPQRFVGICILREGCGLRATFIVRNIIDKQGVEIFFEMYDPTIRSIEVLKLEKRLDNKLLYLRDALPEYCTFDPNMEAEIHIEGTRIPINETKVKLKSKPWLERWERQNLKGVQDLELPEHFYKRAEEVATPWEKYDLMKQYMRTIPEEEQVEIFGELQSQLHKIGATQKKLKRKRTFIKPTKLA